MGDITHRNREDVIDGRTDYKEKIKARAAKQW